jgi:N-acetylmuramoyl-L-alanine amidase
LLAFVLPFTFGPAAVHAEPHILGTLPVARPSAPKAPQSRTPQHRPPRSIEEFAAPSGADDSSSGAASAAQPSGNTGTALPAVGTVPAAPSIGGPTAVSGIRVGDRGAETRFVVELSGSAAVRYHVFTLADPYRVVVDLDNLSSRLPEQAGRKGHGLIADYRYGRFQENSFRIVIDTKGPVAVSRSFALDPQGGFGRRVVIDMAATDRGAFLAGVGLPNSDQATVKAEMAKASPDPVVPTNPVARQDHRRVVVIDPGHGGVDPGTHARSGVLEKDVVLAFGRELAKRLRDTGRYDVYMTRDKDIFIPLRERVQIARRYKADLFISIHADSISKADVRGMSVYTLSETASDKEAAALARKENLSDAIAGIDFKGESPEVTGILIDLAQRETKNYSARFAKSVVDYARHSTTLLEPTHRFAGFVVLKAPDVPSVLVELGFLTNPADEKRLTSHTWRASVSSSFVRAIDRYFGDRLAEGPN